MATFGMVDIALGLPNPKAISPCSSRVQGKPDQALAHYRHARAIREKTSGRIDSDRARAHYNIGADVQALAAYEKALGICRADTGDACLALVDLLRTPGEHQKPAASEKSDRRQGLPGAGA